MENAPVVTPSRSAVEYRVDLDTICIVKSSHFRCKKLLNNDPFTRLIIVVEQLICFYFRSTIRPRYRGQWRQVRIVFWP